MVCFSSFRAAEYSGWRVRGSISAAPKRRSGMNGYTRDFFDRHLEGSRRSARIVVPIIMELLRPKRVVDVGCGLGIWLRVFRDLGAVEILGIDGNYVDRERLEIDVRHFLPQDLANPPPLDRKFDLAVSLEVAEHLPESSADTFVRYLTDLAPAVLFSAAVPCQGGTNHLNEQWPDYWAARFERRGYRTLDCIRTRIWDNPDVECWYAQNMLLFACQVIAELPRRPSAPGEARWPGLSRVHPRQFIGSIEYMQGLLQERDADLIRLRAEFEAELARRDDLIRELKRKKGIVPEKA